MTLVLYQHPFASYCQKVLIALYELDLPFDSHLVPRRRRRRAGPRPGRCRRGVAGSPVGPLRRPPPGDADAEDRRRLPATRGPRRPRGRGRGLFYLRAVNRWDTDAHTNISPYYRDLLARPSIARVVEEARPFRDLFPLPWPADQDE